MKLLIISCLLFAISLAQTGPQASSGAGAGGGMAGMNPYFYDEIMDIGDMYPEVGDLMDNIGYAMGGSMDFSSLFGGMGGAGASSGGASSGGASSGGMGAAMPFMGGDLKDMMSDVVDNMKDGDIYDVMENLLPMAGMGVPGIDMNSIMSGGMPNLSGIMNAVSPYLAMDGDFYGDFGNTFDMVEDMMKYGMGMPGMGMSGMGMPDMGGLSSMMGMFDSPYSLRKNHLHHKLHHARRPSRLLKKAGLPKKLKSTREFPFFLQQNSGQSGAAASPWPFFGTPDSEDIARFLMMGGNRASIPPPVDGIDGEDLWMYRGTKWDPFRAFSKTTTSTQADGTSTQQATNPWLYALLSGLQKRHMQKKY